MKTIVLNYFKNTALVNNSKDAVAFINSLDGISANDTTIKNLESFFNGTSKYPLNEIATTGCGPNRIYVYKALAETLEAHNAIVNERKAERAAEAENRLNEYKEGTYEVDMEIIPAEGRIVYKTVSVFATSLKDASETANANYWANPKWNTVKTIVRSVQLAE